MKGTVSVIVPVYHEQENIEPFTRHVVDVLGAPDELLVVFDSDDDPTVDVCRSIQTWLPALRLVKNEWGRGVLGALKTGLERFESDLALVVAADQTNGLDVLAGAVELGRAGYDVVCPSRYMRGGRQVGPPLKTALSRWAGLSLHALTGVPTHDMTNNVRLYSRRLLESVEIESKAGFELAMELTAKAYLGGFRITELPYHSLPRERGESKFKFREWLPHYLHWYFYLLWHAAARRGRPQPDFR